MIALHQGTAYELGYKFGSFIGGNLFLIISSFAFAVFIIGYFILKKKNKA